MIYRLLTKWLFNTSLSFSFNSILIVFKSDQSEVDKIESNNYSNIWCIPYELQTNLFKTIAKKFELFLGNNRF